MRKREKTVRVIPGFGVSLGVTVAMVSLIVLIPLASLALTAAQLEPRAFFETVTRPRVVSAFGVSVGCALLAALVNLVFGVMLAWVLTRYDFPLKRLADGLIELPLALPTAIAGITLTALTAPNGWVGQMFGALGVKIAYTRAGIVVALIFVGIPFVARAVQPVLTQLEPAYEEAARLMGAGRARTFFRVVLPELTPAALTGFALAFARGLGEYGSVVFIAGNKPFSTEIAPLMIMAQLQEFDYAEATAIALTMLIISFALLFTMNAIQVRAARRTGGA
ncbi:sulfate ABC transporter permease subunit CysT [Bacillota bacterium Meth-B3]|nr:sulfate ABC transporter permease subunit CysT [Christensenellaceae bacterium]MEA5069939.1 sulfate ABC transporter permease subunit CysT [Christensenellaceae bacterium]